MIFVKTKLKTIDNSGAWFLRCIRSCINLKKYSIIAQLIKVSIKKKNPKKKQLKNKIYLGVLVTTKKIIKRQHGNFIKFEKNNIILVNDSLKFLGTKIKGLVAKEVGLRFYKKIPKFLKLTRFFI